MKIKTIRDNTILFDNGNILESTNCSFCADNYADFEYLKGETGIYDFEFDENLCFETADSKTGFRFGNAGGLMLFVPCYSEQNGFYTSFVDIAYKGKLMLKTDCEMVYNF